MDSVESRIAKMARTSARGWYQADRQGALAYINGELASNFHAPDSASRIFLDGLPHSEVFDLLAPCQTDSVVVSSIQERMNAWLYDEEMDFSFEKVADFADEKIKYAFPRPELKMSSFDEASSVRFVKVCRKLSEWCLESRMKDGTYASGWRHDSAFAWYRSGIEAFQRTTVPGSVKDNLFDGIRWLYGAVRMHNFADSLADGFSKAERNALSSFADSQDLLMRAKEKFPDLAPPKNSSL